MTLGANSKSMGLSTIAVYIIRGNSHLLGQLEIVSINSINVICFINLNKTTQVLIRLSGYLNYALFFYKQHFFISNARVKLAKNQEKAKQYPEAEFLLFESYSVPSSTLSSKNNREHCKKCTKNKYVYLNQVIPKQHWKLNSSKS